MSAAAVQLHDSAQGSGELLVMLHGLYGTGNNWGRHAKWLAEHWRVHTPDMRNHGRSPRAEPMTYEAMAADVDRLITDAGQRSAVVLGHSMGGKAAMTLALQRPERVTALIVADIAPVAYEHDHGDLIAAMHDMDLAAIESRTDADARLADVVPNDAIRGFLLTNLQRGESGWRWRLPLDVLAQALPAIQGFPAFDKPWQGPALFIHGGESDYVAGETTVQRIRDHFPAAEIVTLPGAGHFLHVEAGDRFREEIDRWLREVA